MAYLYNISENQYSKSTVSDIEDIFNHIALGLCVSPENSNLNCQIFQ